ncbi:pyruvate dehydrogenase (acetyl-transferring) E1 component subunit alpha [Limnochorda pilosa]|uniref:Pyruvate dehydrogenase E1 component subunit alpha n=1 Tax=Limnochorda pilosa TaxID=1555112 RepID=A0A0K2SGU7_LIMPI|nr:pyruvate dehydrogenase (acetyl-transferring) E1 component subunit alpha [Limnochorda pilosa]BAS26059.1 pyruvate dehydrogenase E1 subunit alpha [Limnochorda pilosa]
MENRTGPLTAPGASSGHPAQWVPDPPPPLAREPAERLIGYYLEMQRIRRFEERAAEAYAHGKIGGFLHLAIGEEPVAVGAMAGLEPDDDVITHYRDHGDALARGLDPGRVMAELYGRRDGSSGGRGGSMHLADAERRFWGGHAIVGLHLPVAVGLALAHAYLERPHVVLCIFGDGSTNTGEFHESLNLAALWRLPVVFLCQNNLYGMGTAVERAMPVTEIRRRAEPYGIPAARVNGMRVLGVREAVRSAARWAREGRGPVLLEVLTYRFRGHSMADPELYRSREEREAWRQRDPIRVFGAELLEGGVATQEQLDQVDRQAEAEVERAAAFAEESPEPAPETLLAGIYRAPLDGEAADGRGGDGHGAHLS